MQQKAISFPIFPYWAEMISIFLTFKDFGEGHIQIGLWSSQSPVDL